jgi:hypothetical protein
MRGHALQLQLPRLLYLVAWLTHLENQCAKYQHTTPAWRARQCLLVAYVATHTLGENPANLEIQVCAVLLIVCKCRLRAPSELGPQSITLTGRELRPAREREREVRVGGPGWSASTETKSSDLVVCVVGLKFGEKSSRQGQPQPSPLWSRFVVLSWPHGSPHRPGLGLLEVSPATHRTLCDGLMRPASCSVYVCTCIYVYGCTCVRTCGRGVIGGFGGMY